MKIKYFISFIIISLALIGSVGAQNIQYPVKELGNCKDESACKSYCDKPENMKPCIAFAEKNNLMSKEEIEMAKKFLATGGKGPGDCRGKDECNAYCNDIAHIDECVTFAVENNLMLPEELEEAKKVQAAIKRGAKPPPCGNKKQCDVYCEEPEHMEKCIAFGIEAGFIQGKELEDVQKMLAAVKRGVKPPPCKGKEACDAYCSNPDNMEMCMNFAMEAGFMNEQEKADSQKMLQALKKGIKPPNCRGKDECDTYCSQEQNFNECTNFAEAAGFMTPEEAAMARKTGGKGPGNCKGKDECDAFCNNPDNQETCFNFAKDNGMIPEADLKQMEEGQKKFQESMQNLPSEVEDCIKTAVGNDLFEKLKNGQAVPPKDMTEKIGSCFSKMQPPPGQQGEPGAGGMIPPAGQTGPGGCKTADECKSYCDSHPDECQNFQPRQGEEMPPQGQPGQMPMPGAPGSAPVPCQGETCLQGPPPNQPGGESSEFQQPPANQQPPTNMQLPAEPQPPMNNIAPPPPPPSEAPTPPPSSSFTPGSSLGSLLDIFLFMFK